MLDNSASNEVPVVSEFSVLQKLSTLNTTKAQGSDGIPGWLLKDNADLLTEPVTEILNISYFENCLPSSWKEADVISVPKQTPIKTSTNISAQYLSRLFYVRSLKIMSWKNMSRQLY